MSIIYVEYRLIGFTIADAFRRDPTWGTRSFTIDPNALSTKDRAEIEHAARVTAPDGYELMRTRTPRTSPYEHDAVA